MKITIKTLQQKTFPFEITETEKIVDLKEKVKAQLGHPVDQQKLIFSGKILEDEKTITEYGVKEGDFFVLMVTKKAPSASSSATPSTSAAKPAFETAPKSPKKSDTAKPKPAESTSTPSPLPPAASSVTPATTTDGSSGLLMGAQFEAAVGNLVEMGFDRPSVVAAMKAAFNNPDRAVEYLMNGIPEIDAGGDEPDAENDDNGGEGDAGDAFAALNSNPQIAQLRQLIRQQPQLLEPLLQQLGQSNPQLLQLIGSNPDAFMQWLEGGTGAGAGGGAPPGSTVVELSQEEMEAVNRLMALGFERNQVIEAYLACDKNEEMAANFLFDSMQ